MSIFTSADFDDHEQVVFASDPKSGLRAVIAIHNTYRGPALGGCRMWPYRTEEEAAKDALRLARCMTYKAAISDLPIGGGKAVIIGDPHRAKTPELMRALGNAVENLRGRYITAEDVGTTVADMLEVRKETQHVVGLPASIGGSDDPSPTTAHGCFAGMEAAAEFLWDSRSLDGVCVAVQGVGAVGRHLVRMLSESGAKLIVTDINLPVATALAERYGAQYVGPDAIYDVKADIFAPCAMGAVINTGTLRRLKARVVAGCANNQLADSAQGEALAAAGTLYAPDYAINAGGMIRVTGELLNWPSEEVERRVRGIRHTLLQIFDRSKTGKMSTAKAADQIAEQRFMRAVRPGVKAHAAPRGGCLRRIAPA